MAAIEVRRFESPDEKLDMNEAGGIDIVRLGWTWEKDEKPLLGQPPSCPMHHTGYCISGTLVVRMVDTDTETRISAGDFFDIPAGHDGYVDGSDRVELILFAPPNTVTEPLSGFHPFLPLAECLLSTHCGIPNAIGLSASPLR